MSRITIDINATCNLSCAFCYQRMDGSELGLARILDIADSEPAARLIQIGGGEPFLHEQLADILIGMYERGRKVHVSTNMTYVPASLRTLDKKVRDNTQVQISLHAADPSSYAAITGYDHFDEAIDNTHSMMQLYATNISSSIYASNLDQVPGLISMASGLGIPIRIGLVFPIGKGQDVSLLDAAQVDHLRGYLLAQRLQKGDIIDSPLIHSSNCFALEKHYGMKKTSACPVECGQKKYFAPDGTTKDCEFMKDTEVLI